VSVPFTFLPKRDLTEADDVQFHPYSPSALKRRSTRQLVEEVQILQLPWSTVISNPHITNAEALKALRTELGRRRVVEFRARREEAAARSETSREGTETGDDGEYPPLPLPNRDADYQ
jgi:hypothetical protein